MSAQPSPQELTAALQQKLALLKVLRCKRATTADVARRFQLEMQLKQCRAEIRRLAEQIDPSFAPDPGAPDSSTLGASTPVPGA